MSDIYYLPGYILIDRNVYGKVPANFPPHRNVWDQA
jgi:hypothetical protein